MPPRPSAANAQSDRFLYEQIAASLSEQILSGNLRPGEKCPSVRQICRQFGVSLSTSVQALALLEARGLVEARPQSGFYVKSRLEQSFLLGEAPAKKRPQVSIGNVESTPLINDVVAAVRDAKALPLGAATVAADVLPGAGLRRSMIAALRELGDDALGYEMPPGNHELRRQIARRALAAGVNIKADDVIITTGSMEALNISLRAVTRPGDTVAIESPMFYGILEMLCAMDLKTAEIPAHPVTGMDLECLEKTIKTRKIAACLAIPNFNNPLGSKMPDAAKKDLVAMLAREGVPLIEDDIYGDLQHDGERPVAAKAFDRKGEVLLCASFSKTLSPGVRIGWVLPGKHYTRVEKLKFVNTIATATVPQAAVAIFLKQGGYERHLRKLRTALCTRIQQYSMAIQAAFPDGTRISQPTGGFVLWVQMPPEVDALKLYHRARAKGIGIIPGPAFSSDMAKFTDCIRLSCGGSFDHAMAKGIKTLGDEARILQR